MRNFQKFVLENGIRLIVAPITDCHEVGLWVFIRGGAQYEKKTESGISHFIEHLLFRGTQKWPIGQEIRHKFEDEAISYQRQTNHEEIDYWVETPGRRFPSFLELCADLVSSPLLRAQDIEVEKRVIAQEINEDLDTPKIYVEDNLWLETCFGDQPGGRPIYGTKETISSFTQEQIRRFFDKTYVGSTIVISIAGGIDPGIVLKKTEEFFGQIKPGNLMPILPAKDRQRHPRVGLLYKDTYQSHFVLGFKTPFRFGDSKECAAEILADILNSRIFDILHGDMGESYSLRTSFSPYLEKSYLYTCTAVAHERLYEAIKIILGEYKKILDGKIDSQDVAREVKVRIKKMRKDFAELPHRLAEFLGRQELYTGNIIGVKERIAQYKLLRPRDVIKAAQAILRREKLNLALIGPHEKDRVEKFLKEASRILEV